MADETEIENAPFFSNLDFFIISLMAGMATYWFFFKNIFISLMAGMAMYWFFFKNKKKEQPVFKKLTVAPMTRSGSYDPSFVNKMNSSNATAMMADDIAIVGVGCRVPGADNLEEFWQVLIKGENHVLEVRDDRWSFQAVYNPDQNVSGMSYVNKAGLLKGKYEDWDNHFFNVSDREALCIDPQQRITLECCHMAFEDAGITRRELDGSNTGVYIGSMNDDFKCRYLREVFDADSSSVTGVFPTLISARVSFVYNLQGPAMTIDTACSSSLVAIHLGYQALLSGDCNMAVCGGVNCLSDPKTFIALSKARMLSPTGQCQAFSKDADGYARGEGCGIVILKRLADAITDGNKVWGVIKTAVNQDGHAATPINAPAGSQQLRLLRDMYSRHNIDKETIQVIEAHGTGTMIGDPTEANALGEFFMDGAENRQTIHIGSVKSNIGHLEGAAGVAGLIKLILMMKHETIVKSLFYTADTGNPKIDFDSYKMKVPTSQHTWVAGKDGIRTGCVNSFGFGGTNAHVTVQSVKQRKEKPMHVNGQDDIYVVALSAPNDKALHETTNNFAKDIETKNNSIHSLSYTSLCKRDHLTSRVAFTAKSKTELAMQVSAFLRGNVQGPHGRCPAKSEVVFVYCGVGTTWTGMCKELLNHHIFRKAVSEVDDLLKPLTNWSILSKLENGEHVTDAMVGPLAIFSCQIGLTALWMYYGLMPDKIVGQSVGEVAAAYTAGCIDLKTAANVIYHRTKALAGVTGGGMMVVKNCDLSYIDTQCRSSKGKINIAVYNSPISCTVSGSTDGLLDLEHNLEERDTNGKLFTSVLNVNCAYHSSQVIDAANSMAKHIEGMSGMRGNVLLYSSVTGRKMVENGIICGTDYYWKMNVCKPVFFHDAIISAKDPNIHTTFIEIGPNPVLRAHAADIIADSGSYDVLPSMTKQKEKATISQTIASLFSLGVKLSLDKVVSKAEEIASIPTYPFQRSALIYEGDIPSKNQSVTRLSPDGNTFEHMYVTISKSSRESLTVYISEATSPFIFTHLVNGAIVIPGATYADVAFVLGTRLKRLPLRCVAVSLEFMQAIRIESGSVNELSVNVQENGPTLQFAVEKGQTIACTGQVVESNIGSSLSKLNLHELQGQLTTRIYSEDSYNKLNQMGFQYGPQFTLMRNGYSDGKRCLVDIELHPTMLQDLNDVFIHPCILDAMLQTTGNLISDELASTVHNTQLMILPVAIGSIRVYGKFERHMVSYAVRVSQTSLPTMVKGHYNIAIMDISGNVIAEVENFVMHGKYSTTSSPDDLQYKLIWEEATFTETEIQPPKDKLLVINGTDTFAKSLFASDSIETAPCQLQYDMCRNSETVLSVLDHAVRQTWGSFENVSGLIFVCDSKCGSHFDEPDGVAVIYQGISANIIALSGLIKALINSQFKPPVFIVTECVLGFSITGEQLPVSLHGSELWGYLRNLQVEFLYNDLTIVDISPSIEFGGVRFSHLVRTVLHSETKMGTDYAVIRDRIYSPCLVKTSKTDISPTHCTVAQPMRRLCSVKSSSPTDITHIYTTPTNSEQVNGPLPENVDVVEIATEQICLSHAGFYPKTITDMDGVHDAWSSSNETGHHVLALEYIGSAVENCTMHNEKNKRNFNSIKMVACYPAAIYSVCRVPKACAVRLTYIPNYQPGLLTAATIYHSVLDHISAYHSVIILSASPDSLSTELCKCILTGKVKQCTVLNEDHIDRLRDGQGYAVVVLSPVTKRSQELLCLSDTLILFKSAVTERILNFLTFRAHSKIVVIGETQLFVGASLQSHIPKISKWLHENWPAIWKKSCDTNQKTELTQLPCSTVTVTSHDRCRLIAKLPLDVVFRSSSLYIVVGGLTGLGWEIVKILAELGASAIATIGRRACTLDRQLDLTELERTTDSRIITLQADITSLHKVNSCIQSLERSESEYNIRGVFQGAGVLDSALVTNMTEEQMHKVLKPKILGTMNLHLATKHCDLDFFLVQSSIAAILGSPGQTSYGAANSFLDTFIQWRRQNGLPAMGINWGPLGVGMASDERVASELERRGYMLLSINELKGCFMHAVLNNKANSVYAKLNQGQLATDYTNPDMVRLRPMLRFLENDGSFNLAVNEASAQRHFDMTVYTMSDKGVKLTMLSELVLQVTRSLVGGDPTSIQMTSAFSDIGIDSISSLTISNVVFNRTGYRLPQDRLLGTGWTLLAAVNHLLGELQGVVEGTLCQEPADAGGRIQEPHKVSSLDRITATQNKDTERKQLDFEEIRK